MRRLFTCLALFGIGSLATARGNAQTAALLAVGDGTLLSEVQLAKVMADDSSLWLSVRFQGRTRLAVVTTESGVESVPAADAWLRALDFATRVRVAAPQGELSGCGSLEQFALADSGLPEPRRVAALEISSASSEIELRRRLADAGLAVEISRVAQFTGNAQPPFRVAIYDVPAFGGSTEALRWVDRGHPGDLPTIVLSGAQSVPLSLIALAKDGVQPPPQTSADPSEFPVAYRAVAADSDYLSARLRWLGQNSSRWLNEVEGSAALFSATRFPVGGQIEPVVSHYFAALSGPPAGSCEAQVLAAHERNSLTSADFACDGADDLSLSLTEVGFAELRLSRFFGMLSVDGVTFQVAPSMQRSPLLPATDFDDSGCPAAVSPPSNAAGESSGSSTPNASPPPVVVSAPDDPYYDPTPTNSTGSSIEGSVMVSVVDTGPNDSCSGDSSSTNAKSDSCSGDSSSSDSSSDSCSGDSSSSDSSGDSCSGDSSSGDSKPDSCSGDTSDSSSDSCSGNSDSSGDSSGCGKSAYDGDTCSGNSADGNGARAKTAGLRAGSATGHPRPRQVRLSLLTLLAAALALPLRRLRASR